MGGFTSMEDAQAMAHAPGPAPAVAREHDSSQPLPAASPWVNWPMSMLDRLPGPYWLVVLVAGASAIGEQVFELVLADLSPADTWSLVGDSLVLPVFVIYILTHLRILKRAAVEALSDLRPSVHVNDDVYEAHARRLVQADARVELALLAVAVTIVLLLFVVMRAPLLIYGGGLPSSLLGALFVVLNYTLLGWLILSLVYCSLRQSVALRGLAQLPLEVNIFDPANLLPFGRLGLIQSMPTVALILIPIVLIGPPTQAGYLVISLSVVSILSLFVPLWGVHRQIDEAKDAALATIYRRLLFIQRDLLGRDDLDAQALKMMADRTAMLTKLREIIQQSPNWPFKDSAAVARALVAMSSPLVYFILNQLIGAYVVPIMTKGAP